MLALAAALAAAASAVGALGAAGPHAGGPGADRLCSLGARLANHSAGAGRTWVSRVPGGPPGVQLVQLGAQLAHRSLRASAACAPGSRCEVPAGAAWVLDASIDVESLTIRGELRWDTAKDGLELRACHVMVEDGGLLEIGTTDAPMELRATIYIKQCGSLSGPMGSRFVGSRGSSRIEIHGRPLARTMSLLSSGAAQGSSQLALKHDPGDMGWRVGDRVGVATTRARQSDSSEHTIVELLPSGLRVSPPLQAARMGGMKDVEGQQFELAAEVVNMERSVLITGDHQDFLATRQGLHVMMGPGSVGVVRHARVEYCGQNGIKGRYCLHFHLLGQCPECIFQGNAIVESFQSGITIHGTHRTTVDSNVLWMNRGVGIYTEDGNEMNNTISHNTIICPYWDDSKRSGGPSGPYCIVKGANAGEGVGIYMVGVTNDVIGNHIVGHQHGLFTPGGLHHLGEGEAHGKVCPRHLPYGIMRGNVNHDNSYFGIYPDNQFPRNVGPRDENGYVIDMQRCWQELTPDGRDNGVVPASVVEDCLDYHNDFVGQYTAGDIMYLRFKAVDCNTGMYWKRSKNFADPTAVHIRDSVFADTTARLPGGAFTFTMEGVTLAGRAQLHSPQHCFGSPDLGGPLQGMTCNVQNHMVGLDSTTHMYGWVRDSGAQVISFGSSGGDPVRILWVAADESLDGYGAIVSPHLNGFALVPGCQGPLSKWGGGFGCAKTTPVRRLNIFGPNFGRITIRGPGYEGVSRDDSEPTFGMNVGSLWWNPPFHDPSRTWNNQGSYAAPVVAGASYTVEGLRWLPDAGQPGDIIIEFSDPHASQSLGNAAEAVTLTLVTDRGRVSCIAAADSDRRFFASGQTGPETGAALGDCGQKFRLLAGQAEATTLERAHRRRRRQYVPVQHGAVEPTLPEAPTSATTLAPTAAPTLGGGCDLPLADNGSSHSCRGRINWLVEHGGKSAAAATSQVNEECSGQCSCQAPEPSATSTPAPTSGITPAPTAAPSATSTPAPTSPSPTGGCDAQCEYSGNMMYGGSDSCRNRVEWILSNGQPVQLSYEIVNEACAGQCACALPAASTPAPTSGTTLMPMVPPTSGGGCDAPCDYNGGSHSCRGRISWLVEHGGESAAAATSQVNEECSGQCSCQAPSPSPTSECDAQCEYSGNMMYGGSDSCRNRVDWILSNGQPVQLSYEIVNEACAGQCACAPPR
ncbi:unnamed protein product [Prorocentrum cordatum]|uniref:G8 domain-containing protein n=1 Tax=Prorocentrum cordatum TaxID=2364126 RepID=A0ABN9RMW0_9DINO|nr:unnamed protein product [Polarella glacialis]